MQWKNRRLTSREPTFQVVLDAIALTPCYPAFLITADVPEIDIKRTTFQVVLDAIALTPCYPAFLITADVPEVYMHQFWNSVDFNAPLSEKEIVSFLRELGHTGEINSLNDVVLDQMHQPWRTFDALINQDKSLSWRNKIGMHTSKDDYLISTLRFVSANESTQIYGAILPKCLTSPAMKESKVYKTYLGYATSDVPTKIARNIKKSSPSKKDSDLVSSSEPHMETKSKRKEKVDVTRDKGIELLSEVALTEEAQMKEVRKKSLRDFHKLHPSGSGTAAEKPPRVDKITLLVTSEGTGDKPGVLDVTKDESTESESETWGNDEDDSNDKNDSENEGRDEENKSDDDKTPSDSETGSDSEQDSDESESDSESHQQEYDDEVKDDDDDDNFEGDEDRGMDNDDVQDKKANIEMTDVQHEKENLKITQEQVVEESHVTTTTIAKETKVPNASVSHSSDLASIFLKFSDIPPNDVEIVSPLDVHVHHEVPIINTSTLLTVSVSVIPEASPVCTTIPQLSQTFTSLPLQTTPTPPPTIETTNIPLLILDFASVFRFNDRVIALEKDVAELKKDPLHTQVTALVDDHLDTRMGATKE
nr:hypothetical protein [Tanacetum cinerariifolium]GEZ16340.1 hypothetical protein [Tanacetum cinerariifolium]